jgi:hypothetical protein
VLSISSLVRSRICEEVYAAWRSPLGFVGPQDVIIYMCSYWRLNQEISECTPRHTLQYMCAHAHLLGEARSSKLEGAPGSVLAVPHTPPLPCMSSRVRYNPVPCIGSGHVRAARTGIRHPHFLKWPMPASPHKRTKGSCLMAFPRAARHF